MIFRSVHYVSSNTVDTILFEAFTSMIINSNRIYHKLRCNIHMYHFIYHLLITIKSTLWFPTIQYGVIDIDLEYVKYWFCYLTIPSNLHRLAFDCNQWAFRNLAGNIQGFKNKCMVRNCKLQVYVTLSHMQTLLIRHCVSLVLHWTYTDWVQCGQRHIFLYHYARCVTDSCW